MDDVGAAFDSFTAVDLETTDNDTTKAEIVEIAAVRVRNGAIVETFHRLGERDDQFLDPGLDRGDVGAGLIDAGQHGAQ